VAVEEARIEQTDEGAFAATPGWFVLNLADARWMRSEEGGEWSDFEPPDGFEQLGIGVHVLEPGQPNGKYHAESVQEDFLVLTGECILIVEEEERRLKAWDFFHCAPGTHHILVGAGDVPCAILMAGIRRDGKKLHYPVSELAARYGASAPEETDAPPVAYGDWSREYTPVRATWPLWTIGERPRHDGPIELVDYDAAWATRFEREAGRIRRALGDRARLVEHVGSTSVPGLAAKPIVDIVLAVPDSSDEGAYVPALEDAGYVLRVCEPEWFEHRLLKPTDMSVNVHVFSDGCPEIDRMLAFRDRLRTNDEDRELYERTKRELAAREWTYVQDYANAKTEVVKEIVARARA
jgi:GrpB-like predicted nucleotidyltransferase (UPF0157 family)/uncharacterized cupin superfamily protein